MHVLMAEGVMPLLASSVMLVASGKVGIVVKSGGARADVVVTAVREFEFMAIIEVVVLLVEAEASSLASPEMLEASCEVCMIVD